NSVEGVIDLGGIESFGVKRKHFRGRQIFWIKASLPFRVLESGSANPLVHQAANGFINLEYPPQASRLSTCPLLREERMKVRAESALNDRNGITLSGRVSCALLVTRTSSAMTCSIRFATLVSVS